jgi:hypothetical protein
LNKSFCANPFVKNLFGYVFDSEGNRDRRIAHTFIHLSTPSLIMSASAAAAVATGEPHSDAASKKRAADPVDLDASNKKIRAASKSPTRELVMVTIRREESSQTVVMGIRELPEPAKIPYIETDTQEQKDEKDAKSLKWLRRQAGQRPHKRLMFPLEEDEDNEEGCIFDWISEKAEHQFHNEPDQEWEFVPKPNERIVLVLHAPMYG